MDFNKSVQAASPFLLGLGSDILGRTRGGAQAGLALMQRQQKEMQQMEAKRQALANLGVLPKPNKPGEVTSAPLDAPSGPMSPAQALAGAGMLDEALAAATAPERTPEMIQYFRQAQADGFKGDFMQFAKAYKQAGATRINNSVNTGGRFESEYDKKRGSAMAERANQVFTQGRAAQTQLGRLDQMEAALDNVYTGAGGESLQMLRRFGAGLTGQDFAGVADGELVQSIANQMALTLRSPDSGGGMPGALSDKDREFLVSMVPGLGKTADGNRQIINAFRKIEQRKIEVARMAADYERQYGRLDAGFDRMVADYANANPLFASGPVTSAPTAPTAGGSVDFSSMSNERLRAYIAEHGG